MHINMHMQTRINLYALFLYLTAVNFFFAKHVFFLGHIDSKISSNIHEFQIEIVFPSCCPFQSEF